MSDIHVTPRIVIPGNELTLSYSRSGGAGGQHVNTTETRVQLRWCFEQSQAIHNAVKERIRKAHPSLVTSDGDLLLAADRHRSRKMNIDAARDRLADIVRAHLVPPKPRRPTKPSRGAKKRRMDSKTRRSGVKKLRGKVRRDD